ncbi:MAG: UpxY family transcription antiterminator [Tannerella sp.]|nr:UpxY family transcription antiterminator [Tannerella sp.]
MKWYVIYTSPRSEKKVKQRLEAMETECYLPLHRTPRVWSDRVKIVEVPLFNSYLFVRCEERKLHTLLSVYGVVRIVFHCGKPAVVSRKEIEAIRVFLQQAIDRPLCEGEEVEILSGALKHISGKIRRVKKKYLMLYIEPLGSTVCVNISIVARVNRIK